ncbi:MAG TPA: LacI family transcriptional regulator [Micrococcales bacterium]|uniref:LacI family transcriptional regulator n=1 Tax=Miniimonas arenae TaxID=676201 RepID=A0A5C5BF80_9MICO|nr:LacI family DNA-binding transcriptional regulator [Miniimonas arenae]TNU76822.1 LacI family transcriptional regulator [Miniimonas arenae]HCX84811.1 LacI family transcriptional regulator [Micrococcales bacterium]
MSTISGRAPTLDEVAREAGVSRSTASRAINGGKRVSPTAQAAVDDAVQRLGFTPNPAARALATQQTGSVALVIPEPDDRFLNDPFLLGVLRGVSGALAVTELQLVLLISNRTPGRLVRYLQAGHVDGAIIASPHRGDHLEEGLRGSRPIVFIGRPFEMNGLSFVDVDNVTGARLATEVLVRAGRTRIGTVAGPTDMTAGQDRFIGWQEALDAAGLPHDAAEAADFSVPAAEAAAERLLDAHDVDAIFVASDTMAVGVRRALDRRGLRVPDDVALVGFDDLGTAELMHPRLTTMSNPVLDLSARATSMLLARLTDPSLPPEHVLLPTRLVPGGSV